jgi:hypothetical protein
MKHKEVIIFATVEFSELLAFGPKSKNPVILSVTHHQNPLESNRKVVLKTEG